eukprot:GEMP01006967.1.p1 GENE.GEMP01006967.1~~GEMP01006967.1.p1  ORF type:complete len:935 (+),score=215.59 GEMP01006967.1:238-3042(+)
MRKSVPPTEGKADFLSDLKQCRASTSQYDISLSTNLVDARASIPRHRTTGQHLSTSGVDGKRPFRRADQHSLHHIAIHLSEKCDPNMVPYFCRLTRVQRLYALEMNHWGRRGIGEYVSADALAGDKVRGEKTNVPGGTMGCKLSDAELNAEYDAFDAEVGDMLQSTAMVEAKAQFAKMSGAEHVAPKGVRVAVDEATRSKNMEVLTSLRHMFVRLGYFALAESVSKRTLTICQAEFPENNPKVLACAYWLGFALQKQGLAADAEKFLRKAASGRMADVDTNALSEDQTVKPVVESLIALSLCLMQQGKLKEAEAQIGRAKELASSLQEDDVLFLRASSEMGMILTRRNRLAEAEVLLAPLADRFMTVCGVAHPDALQNDYNRAALLVELGKKEEAVILAEQTLAALRKSVGELHVDTLRLTRFLAIITDSRELFQQLLVLWRKKCGADHIQHYAAIMDVGTLDARNGNLAAARASFEIAYGGFLKLLGPYHQTTTMACSKIGDTFIEEEIPRDDMAEWYVRTAFSSVECNFGEHTLETRKAANNVAVNLFRRFQSNESLEWFKKYIVTWAQELSTLTATMDDVLCYFALHNYARLLTHMKMSDQKVEEIRRTIWRGWARILGEEHPNTVMAMFSFGETLRDLRKLPEAENILRLAWEARKKLFGDEDPDTLEAEFSLAAALKLSLSFAESKVLHDHAYAYRLQILGDSHSDTAASQYYLSLWHVAKDDVAEAKRMQELCVAGYERSFGPDHYWTLNAVNALGIIFSQKRTNESRKSAEECYYRALLGLEKMFGEVHEEPLRPLVLLAQSKWNHGDSLEAVELLKRAVSMSQELYGPNAPKTITMVCYLSAAYFDAGMPGKSAEYNDWILRGWENIRLMPALEMDPRDIQNMHIISKYVDKARVYEASSASSQSLTHLSSMTSCALEKMISFFDL